LLKIPLDVCQAGIERVLIGILKSGRYHVKTLQSPLCPTAFSVGVVLFGAFQDVQTAQRIIDRLPFDGVDRTLRGEVTEREKSMMYFTLFEQNRQSVSRTSGFSSFVTFRGRSADIPYR
jgi:hypothetical protein